MVDILIIGAGACGLEAAIRLRKAGRSVRILEARQRVGGRVWDVGTRHRTALGAEFIHGKAPLTHALLTYYGLTARTVNPHFHVFKNERLHPAPEYGRRAIARPTEGYRPLLEAMARESEDALRLGTIVRSIEWRTGEVIAHTETPNQRLRYRARAALITVPIGVLKANSDSPGAIHFSPPVPHLAENLGPLEMEPVVRMTLELDPYAYSMLTRKFVLGFPFVASPDLDFLAWWSPSESVWPEVTAWAYGDHARRLAALPRSERTEVALENLARILGVRAETLAHALRQVHDHHWEDDPYSLGAYGKATQTLARPVLKTLYFAGEALDPNYAGTVEGALASGRRQAKKILATLKGETRGKTRSAEVRPREYGDDATGANV